LPALLLLSACATPPTQITKIETVEVKVPTLVPLPEELTEDCDKPAFPEKATVGAAQDLIVELYSAIDLCNGDKADIRELQP